MAAPTLAARQFDAWFARCVARDVSRRFQDAAEALDALRSVLRPPPLPDTRPTDERALRVRALFAALEDHERRGDVEGRVSAGEQLVASGVTDSQTRARTAAAHVARAWSLEARGDREAALAISPGDGDCRFDRCRVRRLFGDTVGAHDDLRHAADLGHALAHHELRALGE